MIVECAGCRTRFRLPVEKIRSSGTKVRCSRCSASFVVMPPGAEALPAQDEPSFNEMPTQVASVSRELLAGLAGPDGEEPTRVAPVPRELLAGMAGPASEGPTRVAPVSRELLAGMAGPEGDEPTQIAEVPAEVLAALRSDVAPPPEPQPWHSLQAGAGAARESWRLQQPEPQQAEGAPDLFGDLDFGDGLPEPRQPAVSVKLPLPPPVEDDPLAILGPAPAFPSLGFGAEDRFTPGPAPAAAAAVAVRDLPPPLPPPLPKAAPAAAAAPEFGIDDWLSAPPPPIAPAGAAPEMDEGLELASESWSPSLQDPADILQHAQAESPQEITPPPPAPAAPPTPIGRARQPAAPVVSPQGQKRGGRVLGMASGIAVLATALAAFVGVRSGGSLPRDPSAVLAAFGLGAAAAPAEGPALHVADYHLGRYPTEAGLLFYVRGTIENRGTGSGGPAVRVVAELHEGERVVARGEAIAGGLPSPEQVHALRTAASWDALANRLGAGWAVALAPGESAPFLVVLGEAAGAETPRLRITAAPMPLPGEQAAPGAIAAEQ